ncbi:MAG: hypothetical protein WC708_05035 [Lentisphaeria bacterium]
MAFFGVPPEKQDAGEKEFFGSSQFEVIRERIVLRLSFSTHRPKVILDLSTSGANEPFMHVLLHDAVSVRVDQVGKRLVVLVKSEKAKGSDPDLEEKMSVCLDPMNVVIYD